MRSSRRARAGEKATSEFIAAWNEVHHDEAFTWWAIERLGDLLAEKGAAELAAVVRDLIATRKAEVKAKFA